MTKEEFEKYYAANSGMSVERLHEVGFYAEPCQCGDETCLGWAMWEHRITRKR